jgi:predicted site-specific integrase-resolvase
MFEKFSIIRQSAAKLRFKRSEKVQRIGIETAMQNIIYPRVPSILYV